MGCMVVGFILAFFMLGERPLGPRLFQSKTTPELEPPEERAPKEKCPERMGNRYHIDLAPSPDLLITGAPGLEAGTNFGVAL